MSDSKPKEVIVLHESVSESLAKDALTFAMVVGIIGVGWMMGSAAMQWCGFLMLAAMAIVRVNAIDRKWRYTPQEAANHLRDAYGVTASSKEGGK